MKDKVKPLSLFGGLSAALLMAWGNAAYAEEPKAEAPVEETHVEQQDVKPVNASVEQVRLQQLMCLTGTSGIKIFLLTIGILWEE